MRNGVPAKVPEFASMILDDGASHHPSKVHMLELFAADKEHAKGGFSKKILKRLVEIISIP